MASNTLPVTPDQLSRVFNDIAMTANTAVALIDADLGDDNAETYLQSLRWMVQGMGALADLGFKLARPGSPLVKGGADEWFGLSSLLPAGEEASHG